MAVPALAADDHPVDAHRGPARGSVQQRLDAQESNGGGHLREVVDRARRSVAFSTGRPCQTFDGQAQCAGDLRQPARPLSQHLELRAIVLSTSRRTPGGCSRRAPSSWNRSVMLFTKTPRAAATEAADRAGSGRAVRSKPLLEAPMAHHASEIARRTSPRSSACSRGDLRAARDGVPRRIGPLDCAVIAHGWSA